METIIRITNDYQSTGAHDDFIEQVGQLVNQYVDVKCEIANSNFVNVVEKQQLNAVGDTFKNTVTFPATGYSQSEWQQYTLRYNCEDNDKYLLQLIAELEKTFTHMNDYYVQKFERETINDKDFDAEPHDFTGFYIRDIEFPDKAEILEAYNDIYGDDYDKVLIETD